METAEIIGFDLGHGETALTITQSNKEAKEAPQPLTLFNKHNQITAIALHDGKYIIGEAAYNIPDTKEFQITFKGRPNGNPLYKQTMRNFIKTIYTHLIETQQISEKEKNYFYIGCPSGWEPKDIIEYNNLFNEFGIPNATVVKESRAALMHTIECDKLKLGEIKSVLIIDIGSSTTDFTLTRHKEDNPLDAGYDLGASLIDKAILEYSLENNESASEIKDIFLKRTDIKMKCEIFCRKIKEKYFNNPNLFKDSEQGTSEVYKIAPKLYLEPVINRRVIESIINKPIISLGNRSWIETFKFELIKVKQKIDDQKIIISAILLTGGASRMPFVSKICNEVFSNIEPKLDNEPELCIAYGLSRWGRVDLQTKNFENEVNDFLKNRLLNTVNGQYLTFIDLLSEALADDMIKKVVKPRIRDWRGGGITTLNDLSEDISFRAKDWLTENSTKKIIESTIVEWLERVLKEIEKETNEICKKYHLTNGTLTRNSSIGFQTNTTNFKTEVLIGDPTALSSVLAYITTIILGIVIALITNIVFFSGPIGLILGIIAWVVGNEIAEEWVKDKDLPNFVRSFVSDKKIEDMGAETKPSIKNKLVESLNKDVQLKDNLTKQLNDWISEAIKVQADKARLLIL